MDYDINELINITREKIFITHFYINEFEENNKNFLNNDLEIKRYKNILFKKYLNLNKNNLSYTIKLLAKINEKIIIISKNLMIEEKIKDINNKKEIETFLKENIFITESDIIRYKANKIGGFIKFIYNKKIVEIAKIPFLIWTLSIPAYQYGKEIGDIIFDYKEKLINQWGKPLSNLNEKMMNDNIYHTEWLKSLNINPKEFYELLKTKELEFLEKFSVSYQLDLIDSIYEFKKIDFSFFPDEMNKENVSTPLLSDFFSYLENNNIDNNINNNENNIISKPFHINEYSKFPLYITPLNIGDKINDENIQLAEKMKAVIIKNSDEKALKLLITLSKYNNSIIFTNNPTETAHLINIGKDIDINIFYLDEKFKLDYNKIYKIEKNGIIKEISTSDFSKPFLPLQNCEENNFYNITLSKKVENLSKLYNNNIDVPSGFYFFDTNEKELNIDNEMIARSAGITEGNKNFSFSGIFKSIKLDKNSIDKNLSIQKEIIDSFSSKNAKLYAERLNIELPISGIFIQDFIKADRSFVIQVKKNKVLLETINDSADKIVSGNSKVIKYEFLLDTNIKNKFNDIIKIIKKSKKILELENLEFEIIENNNKLYVVQVIELKN